MSKFRPIFYHIVIEIQFTMPAEQHYAQSSDSNNCWTHVNRSVWMPICIFTALTHPHIHHHLTRMVHTESHTQTFLLRQTGGTVFLNSFPTRRDSAMEANIACLQSH